MDCLSDSVEDRVLTVPLFPLPNVVLFPRAVLPLHIFEERYKTMTADVLAGERLVAMALLKPGWERNYHQRPAIEPVVCVGQILNCERLADGKYNFLLQGRMRAKIIGEQNSRPYRVARVEPILESNVMEIDLTNERQRLMEIFCRGRLASTAAGTELQKILSSQLPTREVADLIAFHVLNNVGLKQSLLAEPDVARRVCRLISALDGALPILELAATGSSESGDFN
ncbi:MAG: LON peptidase substrate-binding domain-containing protein [Tepidisphaeraceae bacterium]